jgi:hypothetical protein
MRRPYMILLSVAAAALLATAPERSSGESLRQPAADLPSELTSKAWLNEIVRHLYRWYIDERDFDAVIEAEEVVFWVRELKPHLDEGDRSRFGEVVLPQFSLAVRVKQADYTIPELNATVKNTTFRVVSVGKIDALQAKPEGSVEIRADYTELRDELFRTRNAAAFPEGELLERLRAAVRSAVLKEAAHAQGPPPAEEQVVYLAPLSPIANETWVFWETGRLLIRFASDIDLTNPAVWEHETLAVKLFPLDQGVVVSLDEVAGSNAFMTRDEAGRVLFNCIVLGKRESLQPPANAPPQPGKR